MKRVPDLPPAAAHALTVLGQRVRFARVERGWTLGHTADLLGVSRATLSAVEAGRPTTAIGTVFAAAALLRVPLFGTDDPAELARLRREGAHLDALLPARVRPTRDIVDADF